MKMWKRLVISVLVLLVLSSSGLGFLLARTSGELKDTKANLATAETQLSSANGQISSLGTQLSSATSQVSSLQQEKAQLTEIITPTKPTHNLSSVAYNVSSTYWNLAWAGRDYQLQQAALQVNSSYYQWHTYIANETDCNDMACDVWDMLRKQGIISLIVIGNLDLTGETFGQCNHTWLVIGNSSGAYFALEATNGRLYFSGDSQWTQYAVGFFIPSHLI